MSIESTEAVALMIISLSFYKDSSLPVIITALLK